MRSVSIAACISALVLVGCGTTGVVPIGDGIYMSSKLGSMTTFNGGQVKAELFQEASEFCSKSGKRSVPVNSTSKDSGLGTYASAEVQFRCE